MQKDKAPAWALRLLATFTKRYDLPRIQLYWFRRSDEVAYHGHFQASTWSGQSIRIVVNPKLSRDEQKQVMLHELAHAVMHKRHGRNEGHSVRFYKFLWRQYRKYGCDLKRCFEHESTYKRNSIPAWLKVIKEPLPDFGYETEATLALSTTFEEVEHREDGTRLYKVFHLDELLGMVESFPYGRRAIWNGCTQTAFSSTMRWQGWLGESVEHPDTGRMEWGRTRKECVFWLYNKWLREQED